MKLDFLILIGELIVSLFMVFFFIRLIGNKEMKQSTPIEFAYILFLTSIAWDMLLEDKYNLLHVFVLLFILYLFILAVENITYKYDWIEKLFLGKPKIIIQNGKINKKNMKKERLTEKEIRARLREQGIFNIEEVQLAILEINGELSIKEKEE